MKVNTGTFPLLLLGILWSGKLPAVLSPVTGAAIARQVPGPGPEIRVPVFQHELVCYHAEAGNAVNHHSSVLHFASGMVILKLIRLPAVKTPGTLFAELTDFPNGDPQSRQGSVFIIPTDKKQPLMHALEKGLAYLPAQKSQNGKIYAGFVRTATYNPAIELMRFSTPYGVHLKGGNGLLTETRPDGTVPETRPDGLLAPVCRGDSVYWKQDISELSDEMGKEVYLGIYINSTNPLGQRMSFELRFYPGPGVVATNKAWILPLFNTISLLRARGQEPGTIFRGDSLHTKVVIPDGLQDLTLRYLSSAEGVERGSESFERRTNQVFLDDDELLKVTPWRSDCGTFCLPGSAFGARGSGMSRSDSSRSGWCPGALTLPVLVPLTDPEAGEHEIRVVIPMDTAAGSSGWWNVSGLLIGHLGPHSRGLNRRARKK